MTLELRAAIYTLLVAYAVLAFVFSVFGRMMDHNNRYPLPWLISAMVAGAISQAVL